jgi:ankyrin repeat protein
MGNSASGKRRNSRSAKADDPAPAPHYVLPSPEDVEKVDPSGRTAAHLAILNPQIVDSEDSFRAYARKLFELGFQQLEARDNSDWTALHFAVINHDKHFLLKVLREFDADVKAVGAGGETILHLAIRHNRQRSFEYIVENFKELLNIADVKNDYFPLHQAWYEHKKSMFWKLIHSGADVNVTGMKYSRTPLQMVVAYKHLLDEKDEHGDVIQTLIDLGTDLNHIDSLDRNVLMQAIEDSNWDVADKVLKTKKVNLNQVSKSREETVLMIAAKVGTPERILRMMLDQGADPSLKSGWPQKKTAAQIAREARNVRNAEVIESYMTTSTDAKETPSSSETNSVAAPRIVSSLNESHPKPTSATDANSSFSPSPQPRKLSNTLNKEMKNMEDLNQSREAVHVQVNLSAIMKELKELRKEVKELREEVEMLKKAKSEFVTPTIPSYVNAPSVGPPAVPPHSPAYAPGENN